MKSSKHIREIANKLNEVIDKVNDLESKMAKHLEPVSDVAYNSAVDKRLLDDQQITLNRQQILELLAVLLNAKTDYLSDQERSIWYDRVGLYLDVFGDVLGINLEKQFVDIQDLSINTYENSESEDMSWLDQEF